MKKLLLLILFTSCSLFASSEELILPSAPHRGGELSHSFTIVAPPKLQTMADRITREVIKKIEAEKLAITNQKLTLLPDYIFFIDDFSTNANKLRQQLKASHAKMLSISSQASDKADLVFETLQKEYYSGQRPQVSTVFTDGQNGYKSFRIPSVAITKNGTIVAFTEARADYKDQAQNDIVARSSTDGGRTWGELVIVASDGQASLNNPMAVYVHERDRVILIYERYPPNTTEGSIAVGIEGGQQCFMKFSDDGGRTWSVERDLTRSVKPADAGAFCSGPGVGIRLTSGANKGRIVVPMNVSAPTWYNYLIYSDDLGDTWHQYQGRSSYGTNESGVVQISDTTLLVNARSHRNTGDTSWTSPAGWNPWNFEKVTRYRANVPVDVAGTTARWHAAEIMEDQPDPNCQGSIIRIGEFGYGGRSILLLSNAASNYTFIEKRAYRATPPMRVNGSVKLSLDEGKTWVYGKRIYGDRFTESQYSVLVDLGEGKVGCIFEANENIKFAVFDLCWLTGGEITE
ncbi:MAG: sialidase family protein [Mucinivorans sp.]